MFGHQRAAFRRPKFPSSQSKADVAAELAYRVAGLGPVLIFSMQPNWAQSIAGSLLRRIELTKLVKEEIPAVFALRDEGRSISVASEWLGTDHEITQLLRRGVAFHHGRLPSAVKQAIESDFRSNHLSVIVATSTLAQGVNLPVRTGHHSHLQESEFGWNSKDTECARLLEYRWASG